jgi:hypothetical protein
LGIAFATAALVGLVPILVGMSSRRSAVTSAVMPVAQASGEGADGT